MSALFHAAKNVESEDGTYRYKLHRRVGPGDELGLLFIMLNPSTANDRWDDPTIRRCASFTRRERAPFFDVGNLYAYRATDPSDLSRAPDPIGTDADEALDFLLRSPRRIIVAWGAHPMARRRIERFRAIHEEAGSPPLWCLGLTKGGAPRHPLFVRADQPLVPITFATAEVSP